MIRSALSFAFVFIVFSVALVSFAPTASEASGSMVVIPIHIKPGSFENPLNVKSNGILPVAIFGFDIDVMRIDPATVLLGNDAGDQVAWSRYSYQDIDRDGNTDLLIKFRTRAVVDGLGLDQEENGTIVYLNLSGALSDPEDSFTGQDYVLILKNNKKE